MTIQSEPLLKTMLACLNIAERNLQAYDANDLATMSANTNGQINKSYLDTELKNVKALKAATIADLETIQKEKEVSQ
jgi:hypothetical protein